MRGTLGSAITPSLSVALLSLAIGCSSEDCPGVGCQPSATLKIRSPGDVWQDGTYLFKVLLDGTPHNCLLEVQAGVPVLPDALTVMPCSPRPFQLLVRQEPVMPCDEQISCRAPDHWSLQSFDIGRPKKVRVVVNRDGVDVFDQTKAASYGAATTFSL